MYQREQLKLKNKLMKIRTKELIAHEGKGLQKCVNKSLNLEEAIERSGIERQRFMNLCKQFEIDLSIFFKDREVLQT